VLAGIDSAPTALLVDGHGMIRGQLVGQVSPDDMRLADWIDGVLAETWEAEEAGD
jgi:hypothetical protein